MVRRRTSATSPETRSSVGAAVQLAYRGRGFSRLADRLGTRTHGRDRRAVPRCRSVRIDQGPVAACMDGEAIPATVAVHPAGTTDADPQGAAARDRVATRTAPARRLSRGRGRGPAPPPGPLAGEVRIAGWQGLGGHRPECHRAPAHLPSNGQPAWSCRLAAASHGPVSKSAEKVR